MRSSKNKSFIGLCGLFLLLLAFLATQDLFVIENEKKYHFKDKGSNLKNSKPWDTIHIDGNQGWLDFKNDGNCTGSGFYNDPYVIEDIEIDGGGMGNCVLIESSNLFFRIENCTLTNAEYGIKLINVSRGTLRNNTCSTNDYGIN